MNDFRNRDFFHEGMREFQDLFDGRRTAEAIEMNRKHYAVSYTHLTLPTT